MASVTKLACLSDFTLFCGWSYEECARYLETFKMYENKPHDLLLGHKNSNSMEDYTTRVTHALTQIRGVNRTDVLTLTATFGTLKDILQASEEELSGCPGLGPTKVKRLYDAFHTHFYPSTTIPTSANKVAAAAPPRQRENESGGKGNQEEGTTSKSKRQKKDKDDDFDIEVFL